MEASFITHSQPTPRLTLSLVCRSVLHHYSSVDIMKSPKSEAVLSLCCPCPLRAVPWAQGVYND